MIYLVDIKERMEEGCERFRALNTTEDWLSALPVKEKLWWYAKLPFTGLTLEETLENVTGKYTSGVLEYTQKRFKSKLGVKFEEVLMPEAHGWRISLIKDSFGKQVSSIRVIWNEDGSLNCLETEGIAADCRLAGLNLKDRDSRATKNVEVIFDRAGGTGGPLLKKWPSNKDLDPKAVVAFQRKYGLVK